MLPPAQLLMKYLLLSLGLILSIAAPSPAQEDDPFAVAALDQQNKLTVSKAEVLVDATAIAPGKPFTVTLKLTHEPEWHSYYHNDGIGISKIPNLRWTLPEGFTAGELQWPTPHRAAFVGMITYGYLDTNYFSTTITPPTDLPTGENITIDLNADWQTCKESCIDESFSKSLSIPVKAQTEPNESAQKALAAYNAEHLPSDTPEGWNISSKDDGTNITLRIEAKGQLPDDLFFFDFDGQVDPQAAQKFTAPEDGVWELIVPRNKGNDFSDKPGPILDSLYGILAAHDTLPGADRPSVWIETPLDSKATAAPDKAAAPVVVREDTPEEIAEMAALYNSDEKINYVLLKETAKTTLWTALVGAFIGGILLNLMPCVFPVLGIKVLGFVEQAGSDPGKVRRHGLAFTAGLVASMWVLAGTILTLKFALGQEVNWGQQMGNPYFVGAIIILLFVLGLNLAGVFEIGTSLSGAGGDLQRKKGYSGSFFSGVLTTLIATPCSGPFLGAAMSFTLAQPAVTAMFLFTIFALGIASPYLFLSFFPALINKLPRPGAWMETFKKAMSFALFGTAAFFLKTFGTQTGVDGISWLVMGLAVLALATFIYGHWSLPHISKGKRLWLGKLVPIGVAALGFWIYFDASGKSAPLTKAHNGHLAWETWRPGKVELRRSKGRIVWVDYTADW